MFWHEQNLIILPCIYAYRISVTLWVLNEIGDILLAIPNIN